MSIKDTENENKKQVLKIFDNLRKVINRQGIETTLKILKNGISYSHDYEKYLLIVNSIVNIVIDDFGPVHKIKKNDLTKNNLRGDSIQVRNTIFIIINKCLCMNPRKISNIFQPIAPITIWKVIDDYKKLDKNNAIDKKVIENTERLIQKSVELINKKQTK